MVVVGLLAVTPATPAAAAGATAGARAVDSPGEKIGLGAAQFGAGVVGVRYNGTQGRGGHGGEDDSVDGETHSGGWDVWSKAEVETLSSGFDRWEDSTLYRRKSIAFSPSDQATQVYVMGSCSLPDGIRQ